MEIRRPRLSRTTIVSDDPLLAGELSCALARPGHYICVLDGPRLTRDDREAEAIRRTNALARLHARYTLLAGLAPESQAVMSARLPKDRAPVVTRDQLATIATASGKGEAATMRWGRDRIGLGLLRAMYAGQLITFGNGASPVQPVASRSGHVVVFEAGEPLSEVIAANYAFALGAGLHIIDETDEVERRQLLESYYSIDAPGVVRSAERERLKRRLRELVGAVDLPEGGSLTFITGQLPFGAAFPERLSTHLFTYPDLGITIVNGFVAEREGERGTMFVRGYSGPGANVRAISEMVDLFPYDC